jgi:hypothetical protein
MGKGRVDPRKFGMSRSQVQGSWWFICKCPDGSTNMCHYSPVTSIADVIAKSGGDPETHVAKYGSKVLDPNKCLEDYKINLNGSRTLGDYSWDGKLAEVVVSNKSAIGGLLRKFKKGGGASTSSGGGGGSESYDFVLYEAGKLVGADKSGTSDPYVVFSFEGGNTARSSTKKKTLTATWEKEAINIRGPSRDTAELKVQVFDSNVIQKDVLLGEAKIKMDSLYGFVKYNTYSLRPLLVPLKPQGYVKMAWKSADQKDGLFGTTSVELVVEPNMNVASLEYSTEFANWRREKRSILKFRSSLLGVIQFLESRKYQERMQESFLQGSVLQVSAQFGDEDKWDELKDLWTPELLSDVQIFALEVKSGRTAAEVGALLQVVKNTPSITDVHLLDFDRSDAMEHGVMELKGAEHIKALLYSDDQESVNDDAATSLAELLPALPALQNFELVPGNGVMESQHFTKLLEVMAGLRLKKLKFTLCASKADVDFAPMLKHVAAKSVAFKFTHYSFETSPLWVSLVNGLKESPVRHLSVEHRALTPDAFKEILSSIQAMPSLKELRLTVPGKAITEAKALLDLPKIKALSIDVEGETDADPFLEKAASNTTIEKLEVEGAIKMSFNQDKVLQVFKDNAKLKVFFLDASYSQMMTWCNSALLLACKENTTMQYAVLGIFKIYDSSFTKDIEAVNEVWKARKAKFLRSHES